MNKQIATRIQPRNLQPEHVEIFNRSAFYEIRNPTIERLTNVFVFWQGQVFKRFKIYAESISTDLFLPKYGKYFFFRALASAWMRKRLVRIALPCLVVHDEWSMNYFHWMTDALTRLYLVRDQLDELILLIPDSYTHPYHTEVLRKMGVRNIMYTNGKTLIYSMLLVLPNHTAPAGNYNPEILRNAVRLLIGSHEKKSCTQKSRIYISRSRAAVRKITNESEVQACLRGLGFDILYMEDYGLQEAIQIMRQAGILVSIHGAALTNLMFMKPGTCVLELRKQNLSDVYNSYFTLASVFGIHYYYLACYTEDPSVTEQKADISVNPVQLEDTCRMMIERISGAI